MKSPLLKTLFVVLATPVLLTGCSKSAPEKPAAAPEKAAAKPGVTLDSATQLRLGLKLETPAAAHWQPKLPATGRVADPLAFQAAAADYEAARSTAAASQADLERTQKLADQNNASQRTLETAQAAAAHDALALKSAQMKFAADWGNHLASQSGLTALGEKLLAGEYTFIKLSLPVGQFPHPFPETATLYLLGAEDTAITNAKLADDLQIDPSTQVQTLLFTLNQKLPPNVSVTARLSTTGEPITGVTIPASAVIRHEGRGWVYTQSDTNQFIRAEIPLDHPVPQGWFVPDSQAVTNPIVTTGAQIILSTELGNSGNSTTAD